MLLLPLLLSINILLSPHKPYQEKKKSTIQCVFKRFLDQNWYQLGIKKNKNLRQHILQTHIYINYNDKLNIFFRIHTLISLNIIRYKYNTITT